MSKFKTVQEAKKDFMERKISLDQWMKENFDYNSVVQNVRDNLQAKENFLDELERRRSIDFDIMYDIRNWVNNNNELKKIMPYWNEYFWAVNPDNMYSGLLINKDPIRTQQQNELETLTTTMTNSNQKPNLIFSDTTTHDKLIDIQQQTSNKPLKATTKIDSIQYTDIEGVREVVAIFPSMLSAEMQNPNETGTIFYKSTGLNSRLGSTWVPFMGVNDLSVGFGLGTFYKPDPYTWSKSVPEDIVAKLTKCVEAINDRRKAEAKGEKPININELHRFGNLSALIISCWMGGGIWDEPEGKNFVNYLKSHEVSKPIFDNISTTPTVTITSRIKAPNNEISVEEKIKEYRNINMKFAEKANITINEPDKCPSICMKLSDLPDLSKSLIKKPKFL